MIDSLREDQRVSLFRSSDGTCCYKGAARELATLVAAEVFARPARLGPSSSASQVASGRQLTVGGLNLNALHIVRHRACSGQTERVVESEVEILSRCTGEASSLSRLVAKRRRQSVRGISLGYRFVSSQKPST